MNQFEEYTSQEQIFHLQLTVAKLEEELHYYRNGTSIAELMEILHEKDVEIETLTLQKEEQATMLKKLAHTSGEILIQYENVQLELQNKQDLIDELEKLVEQQKKTINDSDETILSLQKRCSTLVSEKRENQQLQDLERQEMMKNLQVFRDSMKEQLAKKDECLQNKDNQIRELNFQLSVTQKSKTASTATSMMDLDNKENTNNNLRSV